MGAMIIRPAALPDAPAIARRLGQRGYPVSEGMVRSKLALLLKSLNEDLLVGEDGGNGVGFLAMRYFEGWCRDAAVLTFCGRPRRLVGQRFGVRG